MARIHMVTDPQTANRIAAGMEAAICTGKKAFCEAMSHLNAGRDVVMSMREAMWSWFPPEDTRVNLDKSARAMIQSNFDDLEAAAARQMAPRYARSIERLLLDSLKSDIILSLRYCADRRQALLQEAPPHLYYAETQSEIIDLLQAGHHVVTFAHDGNAGKWNLPQGVRVDLDTEMFRLYADEPMVIRNLLALSTWAPEPARHPVHAGVKTLRQRLAGLVEPSAVPPQEQEFQEFQSRPIFPPLRLAYAA